MASQPDHQPRLEFVDQCRVRREDADAVFQLAAQFRRQVDGVEHFAVAGDARCGQRVVAGDYESALDLLLELLRRDRADGEDAGRKGLVAVFDLLGGSGELVRRYRARMMTALY